MSGGAAVSHYVQYFNFEKMGRFPNGADALLTTRMGVFTKLPSVREAKGSTVFVIAGLGKPKRYYLWEVFTVDEIAYDGTQYTVSGPGWVLLPPPRMEGKAFEGFKSACANFIGFRKIDDIGYLKVLRKLADEYHLGKVNADCETFCTELIGLLPGDGDAFYYRATVRQQLGKADAAKEDFRRALELKTSFRQEAEAALGAAAGKEKAGAKKSAAEPPARAALGKKPGGVPEAVWRAVQERRGEEDLRQKLLRAYGGRCAITGADAEPALEAALIAGKGGEVTNGLLLRADVRTLFDLNLIRIHPRTRKLFLAEALKKGSYAKLAARQLRLPEKEEDRPSVEALQERWDAAGGPG
jgi:hypothetical protein